MNQSTQTIQTDFDRIAMLSDEVWDHNIHYHNYLMSKIPSHCEAALEIGCGTGAFSRLLAQRSEQVTALDLSPQMISVAIERSRQYQNINFEVADVLTRNFSDEKFDCIVSIATLHHLPAEIILSKIKKMLKAGGIFVCLDLFQLEGLSDILISALAFPVNLPLRLIKTGRFREPYEVRKVWAEHAKNDSYLTMTQVREIGSIILPGAEVKRHLFWRYSLVWKKIED